MKVGILGGTFDPVHNGHITLGTAALRQLKLDRVYFLLSPRSPFKTENIISPVSARRRMLALALRSNKKFAVGTWELRRRGPSYTVTTLADYKKAHPKHEIFLILGSDAYAGFGRWKNPAKIRALATLVVGFRPGTAIARKSGAVVLKGRFPHVSSTAARAGNLSGIPAAVRQFIKAKKLYGPKK